MADKKIVIKQRRGKAADAVAKYVRPELVDLVGYDVPDMNPMDAMRLLLRIKAAEVRFFQDYVSRLQDDEVFVDEFGGKALNVAIRSKQAAMDTLYNYARDAVKLGLTALEIQMSQRTGQQVGAVIQGILSELRLTDEQMARVPQLAEKYLSQSEF